MATNLLIQRVLDYLHTTIGIPPTGCRAEEVRDLPYYLRDAFEFWRLDIYGAPVLLALDQYHHTPGTLSDLRIRLGKIRELTALPVIYAVEALTSYERKRLIEQKVAFVVPGNQLYLPDLGLDLREYFRQRPRINAEKLSPSAQAILITILLRPTWTHEWHPAETAQRLGYTPMTLSRAMRELAATGLVNTQKQGRVQVLEIPGQPREIWHQALQRLRSPVQRVAWTNGPIAGSPSTRLAGLTALASLSMLNDPRVPVQAISLSVWNALNSAVDVLPEAQIGAYEWQLWSYAPALLPGSDTVDPLSLILSLRDNSDERVQSALDELEAQLPW